MKKLVEWNGRWIGYSWMYDTCSDRNTYFAFRKEYLIESGVEDSQIRVSADSRYVLWINGIFVGRGPARCFPQTQAYDSYDIKKYLKDGENCISVLVHQFGASNSQYIHRLRTGLLIDGYVSCTNNKQINIITDNSWDAAKADWYIDNGCKISIPMGFQEYFDAGKEPEVWKTVGFIKDSKWSEAYYLGPVGISPWIMMEERGIPNLLEEKIEGTVCWAGNGLNDKSYREVCNIRLVLNKEKRKKLECPSPDEDGWIYINPNEDEFTAITFDYGCEITAIPIIEFVSEESGDIIDSFYSINMIQDYGPVPIEGFSSEREGACDRLICLKGNTYWEAFLPRGYHYHTIVVRAKGPVKVKAYAKRLLYPVESVGGFESNDHILNKIWEISDNTIKCNMLDAFVDNSWREQGQWLHDCIASAKAAMSMYGDTKLIKRALKQFAQMQMSDGALYSVGPKDYAFMNLCDYNFVWINGLKEYYMNSADLDFVFELQPVLEKLIFWVMKNISEEGLFINPEGNQLFIDWTVIERRPYTLTLNLMLLSALRDAEYLFGECKNKYKTKLESLNRCLKETIISRFWSEEEMIWKEWIKPTDKIWSKFLSRKQPGGWANLSGFQEVCFGSSLHGNALIILLDIGSELQKEAAYKVVRKGLEIGQTEVNTMSPLWSDKIIEALFKCGDEKSAVEGIINWYGREISNGITTWPEQFGIMEQGTGGAVACGNCGQACGSVVVSLFTKYILGCRPVVPGWEKVEIAPPNGFLDFANGRIPTPKGMLDVSWRRCEGDLKIDIEVPEGMVVKS